MEVMTWAKGLRGDDVEEQYEAEDVEEETEHGEGRARGGGCLVRIGSVPGSKFMARGTLEGEMSLTDLVSQPRRPYELNSSHPIITYRNGGSLIAYG